MAIENSLLVPDTILQEWLQTLIRKTWFGKQHWHFKGYSNDGKTAIYYTVLSLKDAGTDMGMLTIYGSATMGDVSSVHISWEDTPVVGPKTHLYKPFDRTRTALSFVASELYVLARKSANKSLPDTAKLSSIHQAIIGSASDS